MPYLIGLCGLLVALSFADRPLRTLRTHGVRSPRLVIGAWCAAGAAWLLTAAALPVIAAMRLTGVSLRELLSACVAVLQAAHQDIARTTVLIVIMLACGAAVGRLAWCSAAWIRHTHRWRRRHEDQLTGCADRLLHGHRVRELPASRPLAYCVPGRAGIIVVTTGTRVALRPEELAAVLTHERAHLRGHHHLLIAGASVPNRAFPGVPLLRALAEEIPVLAEWAADDVAARRCGTAPVSHALAIMAHGGPAASAEATLSATGHGVLPRVRRLLDTDYRPAGTRRRLAVTLVATFLAFSPLAAVGAPILSTLAQGPCACTTTPHQTAHR